MTTQTTSSGSEILSEIFLVLSEKERNIVSKRFSLGEGNRKTLEEIGGEYQITRERVRQIEKTAISKLRRTASQTQIKDLFEIADRVIAEHGDVISEDLLLQEVLQSPIAEGVPSALVALSFEINPKFQKIKQSKGYVKSWFVFSKLDRTAIDTANREAETLLSNESEVVEAGTFLTTLQTHMKATHKVQLSRAALDSILSISKKIKKITEGYGLTKWRSVQPKSIRDKALIILNRSQKPLHFKDIALAIKENHFDSKSVTVQAVHNELIRYEDFVLIGRGIYALKKWGYKDGTVKDVIVDILKVDGPMNKSQIVEEVLKRRQVKVGTISLNLQKYPEFKRVGRAVYSLSKIS